MPDDIDQNACQPGHSANDILRISALLARLRDELVTSSQLLEDLLFELETMHGISEITTQALSKFNRH